MPKDLAAPLQEPQSQRVKWTYQTDRSTTDGVVFAWLLAQSPRRSGKERANEAVRAFYSAFAYRDLPEAPTTLAREMAVQALWVLVGRLFSLAETFDLDLTPVAAALSHSCPRPPAVEDTWPTATALGAAATVDEAKAVAVVEDLDDYDADDSMFG